jgi:hypothetical protein
MRGHALAAFLCVTATPTLASAACNYYPAGDLIAGTGQGADDDTIYDDQMLMPLKDGLGTTKSAVYSLGGKGGGDQCDPSNFDSNNRDTFCESRPGVNRESLNCPSRAIHQGIDIHGGTPDTCRRLVTAKRNMRNGGDPAQADIVPVVAVEDGLVSYIGSYTVDLRNGPRKFRYLHMNMKEIQVKEGEEVKKGSVIGYMFNDFGGAQTIFHLHFEMYANINGQWNHVSPYLSFIKAVGNFNGSPCSILKESVDNNTAD